MIKRVFIISLILLFLVAVFAFIYNFAFRKNKTELPEAKNTSSPEIQKEENGDQGKETENNPDKKIKRITEESVIAPTISPDGESIIYYSKIGKVYKISFSGTREQTISDTELPGLVDVIWSPGKDKVISVFSKDGAVSRYYYNYDTRVGIKLDSKIEQISWTNLGDQIIYGSFDSKTKERLLNLADPDGKNRKNIAKIPWQNANTIAIPQTSLVAFWNFPNSFEETRLITVPLTGGETKTILTQRFGADYLWSPNGEKFLISSTEIKGGSKTFSALANSNGGQYQNLNIPTLTSKCVWSNDNKTIYYALPGSVPEGSVMPNDYLEEKFTTKDTFWKVDITTGEQKRLLEIDEINEVYDATNLLLSPTESKLFFVNRIDGRLYSIDI